MMNFSKRAVTAFLVFSIGCILVNLWVAIKYMPLKVDGSWSACSALSLYMRGSAIDEFQIIEDLKNGKGLNIKFGVFDNRNLRLFPMALWFEYFGTSIESCRILSFVEYSLLVVAFIFFLTEFSGDLNLIILVGCFFATSTALLGLIEDLRPDVLTTALTLAGFTLLHRNGDSIRSVNYWAGASLLFATTLMWPSAAISLSAVFIFFILEKAPKLRHGDYSWCVPLMALIGISLFLFFCRRIISDHIFGSIPSDVDNTFKEIGSLWSSGIVEILLKEVRRWNSHFFFSNLFSFVTFSLAPPLIIYAIFAKSLSSKSKVYCLSGSAIAGLLVMTIFDPHDTGSHLLSVTPFLYALVLVNIENRLPKQKAMHLIFSMIVGLSIILSISIPIKKATAAIRSGFDNTKAAEFVLAHMPKNMEKSIVIGPSALFPYIPTKTNVLIVDDRIGAYFEQLRPEKIDRVFVDRDYLGFNFIDNFQKVFPENRLKLIGRIGNPDTVCYLGVYEIEK